MSVERKVTVPEGRSGMLGSRCWAGPVPADSRMTEGQATSEWLTISSSVSRQYTEHLGQDSLVLRFTANDAMAIAAD